MDGEEAATTFRELVSVIKALRTPVTGCPWDLEQNHNTLRPYLIEEAYEVLDAIHSGDDRSLQEELGDLLLQVVLHAQVAQDRGAFSITDVVRDITEKMVRRHPHVFGSVQVSGSAEVLRNWQQIKAAETEGKGGEPTTAAALAGLPQGLPALLRAQRLGEKAAQLGSDSTPVAALLDPLREQFAELEGEFRRAVDSPPAGGTASAEGTRRLPAELHARLEHGLGEFLFSLCQLARRLGLSAEDSLRDCTHRFMDRFGHEEPQEPHPR